MCDYTDVAELRLCPGTKRERTLCQSTRRFKYFTSWSVNHYNVSCVTMNPHYFKSKLCAYYSEYRDE
jgi:hypothetical protein